MVSIYRFISSVAISALASDIKTTGEGHMNPEADDVKPAR